MIFIPIFREIISCFRRLEKPIKTKDDKIKHLFLYVFIGFPPVFLEGESRFFQTQSRKDAEFSFYEHEMREKTTCFSLLRLAKNCFVGLRPERARFALSPGQRPVVLVQYGSCALKGQKI